MKSVTRLSIAVVLAVLLAAPAAAASKARAIPGQWIVELSDPPTLDYRGGETARLEARDSKSAATLAATAPDVTGARRLDVDSPEVRAYSAHLDSRREAVIDRASATLGRSLAPFAVYRHAFNGFAVKMSAEEARRLERLEGVAAVRPDMAYSLELDEGPPLIGAPAFWNGPGSTNRGEGVVIGIIDSGINWDHVYFSDDPSDADGHEYENPFGEQLGECSKESVPCNDKLIGVYDFAEEGTDGRDPAGEGHGTHVASIAAGNPWGFALSDVDGNFDTSGVAPRANIVSYKVCFTEHPDDEDLDGKCVGSALTEALEQVVEDGVDVVNYSIGGDTGDPWTTSKSFLNVRNAGIVLATSAGNSGPEPGSLTSPGNAPWSFSVASVAHRRRVGNAAD
ncbi:MAG: S8 family serine peptidase, partial [Wenzhouxiangella sp.]